ncbi:hypothetical protein [Lentilactobacillus sp. Marseille-Q4993]|uniref:hypothetical protein n=1 Tax=Lentilactobacillus sp. Marseille-Q4993 TaxID=3039492 RepID=UPI0024BCD33E|nr:hypothetical protein [Lentilactobacillus sp. Marseille-Q4993]
MTTIIEYVPKDYQSSRLHAFETIMGLHLDEVENADERKIMTLQNNRLLKNHSLDVVKADNKNADIIPELIKESANSIGVAIDGKVRKVGKLLSPSELSSLMDGVSVQIPNDPDEFTI